MLNIIGKKTWYFLFSLLIIVPGIVSLFFYGLNLSIDFTGGSRIALTFPQPVAEQTMTKVRQVFTKQQIQVVTLQKADNRLFVRTAPINEKKNDTLIRELHTSLGAFKEDEFATIGPVVGKEITLNAFKAIGLSSLLIMIYIAISFRSVPRPTSSWRFGITTILTLLHDVFVLIGLFSIFGHFFKVEIDSLFVTALLTVIGFSVHDTIVVFDRIRENLLRVGSTVPFAKVVNDSILQTLSRSLNTSLTALLVLFTLLVFGGETIKWFIVALLIGIASGTYSSIFNAAPLLVLWHEIDTRRKKE